MRWFLVFVDSFVSLRFNVPRYGVNPSFSVICFLTHGSFRNRVPPPCPVKILPFRVTGCRCCAFFIFGSVIKLEDVWWA